MLVELSRPAERWRVRTRELLLIAGVAALTLVAAAIAGSVERPLRPGQLLMFAVAVHWRHAETHFNTIHPPSQGVITCAVTGIPNMRLFDATDSLLRFVMRVDATLTGLCGVWLPPCSPIRSRR